MHYFVSSARRGPAHAWSRCSSGLRVEPILVRLMTKVEFCFVPKETAIFDSLIADLPPTPRLWRPGVFGQIRDGKAKSANIELCVIASSREA